MPPTCDSRKEQHEHTVLSATLSPLYTPTSCPDPQQNVHTGTHEGARGSLGAWCHPSASLTGWVTPDRAWHLSELLPYLEPTGAKLAESQGPFQASSKNSTHSIWGYLAPTGTSHAQGLRKHKPEKEVKIQNRELKQVKGSKKTSLCTELT